MGSFLDQQWGLLIHAPLLVLAFSGLLVMGRRDRRELAWLAVICLPYFLLIINYKQWWGEWCPPARYLAPLVPLLALPLAHAVPAPAQPALPAALPAAGRRRLRRHGRLHPHPPLLYNHPVGQSSLLLWLAAQGGPDLTTLVPTFFLESRSSAT